MTGVIRNGSEKKEQTIQSESERTIQSEEGLKGKGISDIVRKECDFIASIPMKGEINSLNASVAAGIIIFRMIGE